jgi:hypothetical protein
MDIARDIMAHVEVYLVYWNKEIIIVLSLHLGEPLVLDLTMIIFISLPYIVLHHNFQFLCLISFSEFRSGWWCCSGFSFSLQIFMFFLMFLFRSWVHGVFYRFHALNIPNSFFHHGSGWKNKDTLRILLKSH